MILSRCLNEELGIELGMKPTKLGLGSKIEPNKSGFNLGAGLGFVIRTGTKRTWIRVENIKNILGILRMSKMCIMMFSTGLIPSIVCSTRSVIMVIFGTDKTISSVVLLMFGNV